MLPDGFHYCDNSDFGGWWRSPNVVENDVEVELWWEEIAESGVEQPVIECAYCEDQYRPRSKTTALRWWYAHDCDALEKAESKALVVSLTPLPASRASRRSLPSALPKAA